MEDEVELEGSLEDLFKTSSLRWIFVGGKGGVGKTTTSCAIAVQLSQMRESVLIISTDPAHNISDAFTQKFSNTPSLVKGFSNLYAMEIDSSYQESCDFRLSSLNENSGESREGGRGGSGGGGGLGLGSLSSFLPDMLQAIPGIDEALSFAELLQSVQTMKHSVIVFDTAPTGHTLRLLAFPDLLERGLGKLSLYKDKISSAIQMVNTVAGNQQAIQEQDFASKIENLKAVTTSVREAFQDPSHTTFVCVCIPEFLSVYETERLVQELAKQKIDCSHVVVNQVLFPIGDHDDEDERPPASLGYSLSSSSLPRSSLQELLSSPPRRDASKESLEDENERLRSFIYAVQSRLLEVEKSFFARRAMQARYLQQIRDLYSFDFHVVSVPQQSEEVRGVDHLRNFGQLLRQPRPLPILHQKTNSPEDSLPRQPPAASSSSSALV